MNSVSRQSARWSDAQVRASPSTNVAQIQSTWFRSLLWLALAASSIVFVEPAPYDLLVICLTCGALALGMRVPRSLGPAVFLLALFILGNLVGALSGGYLASGIRSLSIRIYMVMAWLLFAGLIAQDPRRTIHLMWSGYIVAAFIAVCWGIGQYYGFIPGELTGPEERATGPFKDANVFAPFLVPVALLTITQVYRARDYSIPLLIGWFLLLMSGILLAFSRGAWINFIASFVFLSVLLVVRASSYRQQLTFILMIVALVLVGFSTLSWVVNNTAAGDMFAERSSLVQTYDVAAGGRFATQSAAVQTIGRTPFGIGPGMSTPVLGMEPHNIYLHVALEGGWLGGLSLYAFFLLTIWRGVTRLNSASGWLRVNILVALAALLGVLLQSFFIDSTHWRHLWLLLAMVWGLTAAPREEPTPSP